MTLQEAYLKAKDVAKDDGLTLLTDCSDYGEVWGFGFMPPTYDPKDPGTRIGGGGDVTVNKKTGEIGFYLPHVHGFDLLDKAKPVPIEQFERLTRPAATPKKKQKRAAAIAAAS